MAMSEKEEPKWAADHGLHSCGDYYEGFVDDLEAVLSQHRMETVTSYGVRRSRQVNRADKVSFYEPSKL